MKGCRGFTECTISSSKVTCGAHFLKLRWHLLNLVVLSRTKLVHQLWQLVHTSSVVIMKTVIQDVSDTLVVIIILPAPTEMTRAFFICVVKVAWHQIFVFWLAHVTGRHSQFLSTKKEHKDFNVNDVIHLTKATLAGTAIYIPKGPFTQGIFVTKTQRIFFVFWCNCNIVETSRV